MPKIARLDVVPLEHVLPEGRAYGTARGLNYRRTCSLITLETDDGIVGIGDAAGPVGAIREYLAIAAPFFVGRRLFDFEIIAAQVKQKLYHFGVQNHLTSCLGGINIAVYDALGKTLKLPGVRSPGRPVRGSACRATPRQAISLTIQRRRSKRNCRASRAGPSRA